MLENKSHATTITSHVNYEGISLIPTRYCHQMKCCCLFLLLRYWNLESWDWTCLLSYPHVQVLTRFICSSSPVIYWFAADALKQTLKQSDLRALESPTSSDSTALLAGVMKTLVSSSSSWSSKLIVAYFFLYVVLGYILHCNFYPWT